MWIILVQTCQTPHFGVWMKTFRCHFSFNAFHFSFRRIAFLHHFDDFFKNLGYKTNKFRVVRKQSYRLCCGKFESSSTNIFFNIYLYQILNTPRKRPWEQLPDVVLPVPKFVLGASKKMCSVCCKKSVRYTWVLPRWISNDRQYWPWQIDWLIN